MARRMLFAMWVVLALAVCTPGWAQTGLGTVGGTVTDPSGAAVPGAIVTLTNQGTQVSHQVTTSSVGAFYFGQVQPGNYSVTVAKAGFRSWTGTFTVLVNQTATVSPKLVVGSTTTTVQVTGAAPVINTTGTAISSTVDMPAVHQLPINGRSVNSLFSLTPGLESGASPQVNGMKVGGTAITVNGMSVTDRNYYGVEPVDPGLDSIAEFSVETSGSDARYIYPSSIIMTTRSGTNQLHGDIFEQFQGNSMGAARQRQTGSTLPEFVHNEFGGAVGGPVYLPHIYNGKDKTFWFFSYEGERLAQSVFDSETVPTPAMWNGDFNNLFVPSGQEYAIYNPYTTNAQGLRQQFPGNIIPQNMISPFWGTMKKYSRLPTNNADPYEGVANLNVFYPKDTSVDRTTGRVDQHFGDKDTLSVNVDHDWENYAQLGGEYGDPPIGCTTCGGGGASQFNIWNGTVTEIHSFKPNLVSQFMFGINYNPNHSGTISDYVDWDKTLDLPNPFGASGWPTLCLNIYCWDNNNPQWNNFNDFNINEDLTWIHGNHTVSFGGLWHQEADDIEQLQQAQGSDYWSGEWTSLYEPAINAGTPYTGLDAADMALGTVAYLSNQYNYGMYHFRQGEEGLYAQDVWKLTRKLTLTAGLRWDRWSPYGEVNNRLLAVNITSPTTIPTGFQVITPYNTNIYNLPDTPKSLIQSYAADGMTFSNAAATGLPGGLWPSNNHDFAPRLGAAWLITPKTVLRAGFGMYYWTMPLAQLLSEARVDPPLNLRYQNEVDSLNGVNGLYATTSVPTAADCVGAPGCTGTVAINGIVPLTKGPQGFLGYTPNNFPDDRVFEWNATLQRQIGTNTAVSLSWIGNYGDNLEQRFDLDDAEPVYNYSLATGLPQPANTYTLAPNDAWSFAYGALNKSGYSNANSLQAEVTRHFTHNLSFMWFYDWTRAASTTDAPGGSAGDGSLNNSSGTCSVPEAYELLGASMKSNVSYSQLLNLCYYNDAYIPPQRMTWDFVYDLPVGRGLRLGRNMSKPLNTLIGGWRLSGIGTWDHGFYTSIATGEYMFRNPSLNSGKRLNLTYQGQASMLYFAGNFDPTLATNVNMSALDALVPANESKQAIHPLGVNFDNTLPVTINGQAQSVSTSGTYNYSPFQDIIGPAEWNEDLSLQKIIPLGERVHFRIQGDFFNTFNHPNNGGARALDLNKTTGLLDLAEQQNAARVIQVSGYFVW
jgi:hypothetical protein